MPYKLLTLAAVCGLLSLHASAQCNRATVVADYLNVYLPSEIDFSDLASWTGDVANCDTGSFATGNVQAKTLARINYYRKLVGVPNNITFDPTEDAKCREAALMMDANNQLNHNPPSTWTCYTAGGANAAASSNLYRGTNGTGPFAVNHFMSDHGTGNTAVAHRRWLLHSRASIFGHGATPEADAIWITGNLAAPPTIDYIAYPPSGYFPYPLLPQSNRWSFGVPGGDFSAATVTMKDSTGANMSLTVLPLGAGFGDPTIVWEPVGIATSAPSDIHYQVTVNNVVVNGTPKNFSYEVRLCNPVHPPACPGNFIWSDVLCACVSPNDVNETEPAFPGIVFNSPFTDVLKLSYAGTQQPHHLSVVNMEGKTIRSVDAPFKDNAQLTLETSTWPAGVYVLQLTGKDGLRVVEKCVKQ